MTMRLLKPSWVTLDEKPIFSIDIHPDGSRFATGGQGDDCGKVVIWNMAPVREEKDEKDEDVPKILCQMDNHLGCVNCVRWSLSGKHLASGGDDKLIMIWQSSRYAGPSTVFGSGGKMVNIEQWRAVSTLRGHSGDVLDLAWSPHDAWLASCSVDNTIVVWNTLKFPEQICVLRGHSGLVKGVTWDPVGKYLASQSDDKSLRVWRTMDWQQEAIVTEPFQECSATTHILRLNWSPDGHYVVSAHAMNNSGPTAQIIERDGWKTSMDFVGHRKAVTVVRFNPNILSKKVKKDLDKPQQYTCCAIGSRDRSLSIWLTALKRPLVVTHDLFSNSILDISWSRTGMELLCCSWDGTVAFIDFTPDEIGNPLSPQEVRELHERIYGKSLAVNSMANTGSQVIESTALLNLRQQQQAREAAERDLMRLNKPLVNGKTPFKPTDKQIETRTADGRRRITPIFLAPQPDLSQSYDIGDIPSYYGNLCPVTEVCSTATDNQALDIPLPFSNKNITFTSSTEQSKIVIEKQDRVTGPGISSLSSSKSNSTNSSPAHTGLGASTEPSPKAAAVPAQNSPETGVISIQPINALESIKSQEKVSETIKLAEKVAEKLTDSMNEKPQDKNKVVLDRPTEKEKTKLKTTLTLKRKLETSSAGKVGRPRKEKELSKVSPAVPVTPVVVEKEPATSVPVVAELYLPVPKIEKSFSKQIAGRIVDGTAIVLEVENNVHLGAITLHKLKCSTGGKISWEQVLTNRAIALAGSNHISCVACDDHTLSVFTPGGRKVCPSLVLNSKVSVLETNGYYLMAITQKGTLHVWNIQKKAAVIRNEALNTIMTDRDLIVKTVLTKDGVPIVSLSNNRSYTFSPDFGCWVLVASKRDPLQQHSDHHSCVPTGELSRVHGTLSSLQSTQERLGSQASRMYQSTHSLQQISTLSHLSNQLAACMALNSSSEYKFWLLTYVRYLVQEAMEGKLREICDELIGPLHGSRESHLLSRQIVGLNKQDLLEEILPIIGSNLRFQRLFTEYQDQLVCLKH